MKRIGKIVVNDYKKVVKNFGRRDSKYSRASKNLVGPEHPTASARHWICTTSGVTMTSLWCFFNLQIDTQFLGGLNALSV